ncbi:sacsin N-terminal ATP-binding-like domain-containing protein [Amycolatopsis sp. H20-H5]|uniref:sacsin N-terminal ATP-binding-like domain-containing protein n=1 Tax=Amycolatopsis sp. H20-H5 TaxID=3046309 RepID=UPI002DB6F507|nr:molecular chaperone Hsp90 [Amycolatopsis sp. H20-H5]MEC3981144.1 molecular chaperone Hsp90 [Amycolatopsis sp. H20-H5]
MTTTTADPFGTARLREAVLRAWRDSPTRFTEDTNAEGDLRVGGYRDRLFVELAQNAADAALAAGKPGTVRVSFVDGELRFANTGAPLDGRGVESLSSLRASGKRVEETVGRFGVGFAAVLTVSGAPRVVSTTGGVAFSEERTREVAERSGDVAVLRLPWPVTEEEPLVPQGFDTEVRLPLREGVDASALLETLATDVPDLLLALPWLARVEVGDQVWTRADRDGGVVEIGSPAGSVRWLTHTGDAVWAIPVDADGVPRPLGEDVLHAPTPTDDKLSLPARLIASFPLEPSRRRVLPGAALTAALGSAAREYVELVRAVKAEHRLRLVPGGGFPRSTVDGALSGLLLDALRRTPWLPAQSGAEVSGAQARVLAVESADLPPLLPALVPGLLASPLCGPAAVTALAPTGAQPLTGAELIEALTGIDRPPAWWHSLYDALLPLAESHALTNDDLGGLSVPMSDGRTLPGVRDALLVGGSAELLELLSDVDILGLRLVHPEAAHPLLERLGAKHAEARDLLAADALRDAVERSVEDALSGLDGTALAGATLRLVAETGDDAPEWIGALALPCDDGWRRADELVLPGSPLREIFDPEVFGSDEFGEDGAMSVLDDEFAEDWPAETLVAAGVLDTFAVVVDEEPIEPEHNLPDEDEWWDSAERPPSRVLAVRDLDLVADDAWPAALRLLASRPETLAAVREPGGHARWWLARYALLDGRLPGEWRLPEAAALTGLYDEVPDVGLSTDLLKTVGVRADLTLLGADDVEDLLDRLGDPDRKVTPGLASRAHTALAKSEVDFHGLNAPARVRAVDGTVADADDAVVLDVPWPVAVLPAGRLVSAAAELGKLAELLDLPLASALAAEVTSEGEHAYWTDLAAVSLAAELTGVTLPDGGVLVHEVLTVSFEGTEHEVPWWFDGRLHASDTSEGLARAYAWAADRWPDRHLLAALLEDPSPTTLLG